MPNLISPIVNNQIIQATNQQDINKLVSYNQEYNLNLVQNTYGDGLLSICILNDVFDSFATLLDLGLNVNQKAPSDLSTPTNIAAMTGNTQFIPPLYQYGADLNLVDKFGFTPLLNSLYFNNYETANHLLGYNEVNVNLCSHFGDTPLMIAYIDNEWGLVEQITQHPTYNPTFNYISIAGYEFYDLIDYLDTHDLTGDLNYFEAFEAAKLLGLRFDFDNSFTFINLLPGTEYQFGFEGWGNHQGIYAFDDAFNTYYIEVVSQSYLPTWGFDCFNVIHDCLNFSATHFDGASYFERYVDQQPLLIPSGWDMHAVTIVIDGDRLYRCNRGYLSDENFGIEEYQIHNLQNLTPEFFQTLLDAQGDHTFVQQEMLLLLGCEKIGVVECEPQIAGNCVWTSLEAGLEALLITTLLNQGLDNDSAHILAKQNFNLWENFDMTLGIKDIINSQDVLIENNAFDDLLFQVLDQNHDPKDIFEIDRGILILDEIFTNNHTNLFNDKIGSLVYDYDINSVKNISYMENYAPYQYYLDYILDATGMSAPKPPSQLALGHEYYDYLYECSHFDTDANLYTSQLSEIFSTQLDFA